VVANSDMPGFTERERMVIAALCRYHRKALPNAQHNAFEALTPEERKVVMFGIPILRLADNLDRSHEQRVLGVECKLRDSGDVLMTVTAKGNIDLEQWAAQRAGEIFREIYGRGISITRAK